MSTNSVKTLRLSNFQEIPRNLQKPESTGETCTVAQLLFIFRWTSSHIAQCDTLSLLSQNNSNLNFYYIKFSSSSWTSHTDEGKLIIQLRKKGDFFLLYLVEIFYFCARKLLKTLVVDVKKVRLDDEEPANTHRRKNRQFSFTLAHKLISQLFLSST